MFDRVSEATCFDGMMPSQTICPCHSVPHFVFAGRRDFDPICLSCPSNADAGQGGCCYDAEVGELFAAMKAARPRCDRQSMKLYDAIHYNQ